jgi:aminoglycoside phosphotransferase (APT) family kinase protein
MIAAMAATRMHADEIATDPALVRRLLADQFPQWAELPIRPVGSHGTDHDIYRLGDQLATRLPRIGWATSQARTEAQWLPRFAPQLPLAVAMPVAMGRPGAGYPFDWSVCTWLPGDDATGPIDDLERAAVELAAFVRALRRIDPSGGPARPRGRGGRLVERDVEVRRSIAELDGRVDPVAALDSWEQSLAAAAWDRDGVWVHGDLLPGNLIVVDGHLSAVIDWGCLDVGDPAVDLLPAWNLFTAASRARFRSELEVDDATWLRGRGWALCQAVVALPYYWDTNPGIVAQASRALAEVLADLDTPRSS